MDVLVYSSLMGPSYLLLHVIQRVGRIDGEADEDDMAIGV